MADIVNLEWAVVGVIVVLIGLVTSIVTPMIKLNTSLNQYSSEFLSLAEGNQLAMEAIQNPTQKRIGGK